MPKPRTWTSKLLPLIAILMLWTSPTLSFADDLKRCKTSLAEANSIASAAVTNAEKAAKLTKEAKERETAAKEQRDANALHRDDARRERDNLAGEIAGTKREGARFRVEFAGLQLRHDDLKLQHGREWSPYVWMSIGAGGAVATWLVWNFVLAPRLFAD